ncbi:MAG TPA: M1 family metallopeptidase [Vicinamibacterales bacterium]|nr:M1 family metallopeptidase [Vicinamibacterales bacterium]
MTLRRHARVRGALLACSLGAALTVPVQARQDAGLAPRTASYSIDATLDADARTLTGRETITWRNPGGVPAYSIRLHLYWNAWRNTGSTWLSQLALAGVEGDLLDRPAGEFGWQQVTELRVVNPDGSPGPDLMPSFRYIQPSDQNSADRSLAAADLPAGVAPGQTVRLQVGWRAQVPRTFSRTGVIGNYFFIGQWFPKLGVFDGDGWVARQFFANTEFFADFGSYDVRLTVPRGWVVGATGREVSRTDTDGEATIHRYTQDDVHDFAWTTSPDFVEARERFEHEGLPPVEMRLLLQPEHRGQEERHFAATAAALRYYGEWYGPYPYPQITIIDPAWQSGSGGMEYPTLFTAGTRWLAPRGTNQPESVTVHEAGHQFWYGLVASNEVVDAWMDEGFNTFSEERVQSLAFTPNYRVERFFGGFIPWQYRDIAVSRATDGNGLNGYRRAARRDMPSTPSYLYWPATHADITYGKTALWMHTLERMLGWDRLRQVMATYFHRYRFKHPRPDDFFAVANAESGRDLTWFFDEVYRSSNVFDYAVERLDSVPVGSRGFVEPAPGAPLQFQESANPGLFRTTVVLRRIGEAKFPVDMVVTFEDGERVRETWDGQARWRPFIYEKPARAVSAQVDPDRVLLLDVNYTNNSVTLRPQAGAAADHWTLKWMVWLQDLLMDYAFFV